MARPTAKRIQKTSKTNARNAKGLALIGNFPTHLAPFLAGFAGAALAIAFMMLAVIPMMKSELSQEASAMGNKVLAMVPASDSFSPQGVTAAVCTGASTPQKPVITKPAVQTAVKTQATQPGSSPQTTAINHAKYVSYMIGNLKANSSGSNSYTGANSTNTVSSTNTNTTTITNHNNLEATNNNSQTAVSGNVNSSENTSVGAVKSGDVSNQSSSSFVFKIDNN